MTDIDRLALAAMDLHASIRCGGTFHCDLGHHCAAHGGDNRDEEWWTIEDEALFTEYKRRYETEVER